MLFCQFYFALSKSEAKDIFTIRPIRVKILMMFRSVAFIIFVLVFSAVGLTAQQRPLLTEDVDTTPEGAFELAAGVDFLQKANLPVSGYRGDLTRVGDVRISVGFSKNVEFQIDGVLQNFLSIDSRRPINDPVSTADGNSTNDIGDFTLSTKIRVLNETERRPALGFTVGFQLPNSNQTRGIGTNQINVFGKVIAQKRFGSRSKGVAKLNVFGNLGMGIFTAPLAPFTQNDMLLYGLAGIYRVNDSINMVAEVNGRANTRPENVPIGTESIGQFRVGTQIKASNLRFDAAAIFGLTRFTPKTGVTFGVTYISPKFFTPAQ